MLGGMSVSILYFCAWPQGTMSSIAMAPANAALMNVLLVLLIVPFIVDCPPNNTVTVFAHSAA